MQLPVRKNDNYLKRNLLKRLLFLVFSACIFMLSAHHVFAVAPNNPASLTQSTNASTLASSTTYTYAVSAVTDLGETTVSSSVNKTTGAGANEQNTVSWNAVVGASYYKVYRGAAGSTTLSQYIETTNTSLVDTGNLTWESKPSFVTWNETVNLNNGGTGVQDACSVAYNGYLYAIGGSNGSTHYANSYYAPINTTGTSGALGSIGSWTSTASLTDAVDNSGCVAYNGYVYVLGGYDNTAAGISTTVYYSQIQSTGALGTWGTTTGLTTGVQNPVVGINNGYIYILGGKNGATVYNNTYYASINTSNGTIGSWNSGTALPAKIYGAVGGIFNGYVYVVGGTNDTGTILSSAYEVPILGDGSLGTWVTTNSIYNTTAITNASGVLYNNMLYVIGGKDGTTYYNTVEYAIINPDGTLSQWGQSQDLFGPAFAGGVERSNSTASVYNGYIYVVGGYNGTSDFNSVYDGVIDAKQNSSGALGSFSSTLNGPGDTGGVDNFGYAQYNGFIYKIGGTSNGSPGTDVNTVYYTQIKTDGTLTAWSTTTAFPCTYIKNEMSVVYNGYIYVLGGNEGTGTGCGTAAVNWYAPINSDGTIGTWSTTTSLATGVASGAVAVNNGYVYMIAGTTGSNTVTVQYAPFNANGTLGTWTSYTSGVRALPVALRLERAVAYNSYIYVIGGANSSGTAVNTVYYIHINSDGSLDTGGWITSSHSYVSNIRSEDIFAYNGYIYVMTGYNGTNSVTTDEESAIGTGGAPGSWSSVTGAPKGGFFSGGFALYDGYFYIFGGWDGTANYTTNNIYDVALTTTAVNPGSNTAHTNTNSATITWTSVGGATGYRVYRGTASGSENVYYAITGGTVTSFVDAGLSASSGSPTTGSPSAPTVNTPTAIVIGGNLLYNTTYYYKVSTISGASEGNPSTEVSITPTGTLSAPTGLAVSNTTNAGSSVSSGAWSANTSFAFGATISSSVADTLNLLVEVQPLGVSFTNSTTTFVTSGTGVYKGTNQAYTSGTITTSDIVSGLPSNIQYHWQALVMGTGGNSSWVAMGGTPDFGVDITSPLVSSLDSNVSVNVLGYSAAPTSLFSDTFESGNFSNWTSTNGSTTPVIQSNTAGVAFQGSDSAYMTCAASGNSYIEKTGITASSNALVRGSFYISADSFNATNDTITLFKYKYGSGSISALNLVKTGSGIVLQAQNLVSAATANGNTVLHTGMWYTFSFYTTINASSGIIKGYINGVQETSLTSQNTGTNNITILDAGIVATSSSDSVSLNLDEVMMEDLTGLTQLTNDDPTPQTYATPYFEMYGQNDQNGSAINNYDLSFSTTASTTPATSQSGQTYTSSTISTAGIYYFTFYVNDNVSNTSQVLMGFLYNFASPVPSAPSSLQQYRNDGTTIISNGAWTTDGISNNVVFKFTMTSPNTTDTLTPAVELIPNSSSFTGTPNYTGSSVGYSGTGVTGTVTVTGLTNCTTYKWQAFVENTGGTSSATVFNLTQPNFGVASSSPTAGTVYDGSSTGVETSQSATITPIYANWSGFSDSCSGLPTNPYTVAVGTTVGGTDILNYTSTGISGMAASLSSLAVHTNQSYYVTVKAINNAGLTVTATSSGQTIQPSITFTINSSSVNLGTMNNGNSYAVTGTTTLQVLADSYHGYNVYASETGPMTDINNGTITIPDFSAGTYASPASWPGGTYGFGYTTSCTNIGGSNPFSGGTKYAPFNHTGPGDIVAQNATQITGANYTGSADTYTMTYKAAVSATQQADTYQTNIIYTAVATF